MTFFLLLATLKCINVYKTFCKSINELNITLHPGQLFREVNFW